MDYNIPENLLYTEEHEWINVDGDTATLGITDFAQSSLGDIVFVEVPEVGDAVSKGSSFGVVESIKSVSDLYSPIDGEVLERNEDVEGSPEGINSAAYDSWLIKIKITDKTQLESLMNAQSYTTFCQNA
jgi:glycine cleavage system H protein